MKFTNVNRPNETMPCDNIRRIIIYGDGEKLMETDSNYFEEYKTDGRGLYESVYNGRPVEVFLSELPKRANKENLNRKDNYFKKTPGRYSWEADGICVYIHKSEIMAVDEGEKLSYSTRDEKNYLHAYTLTFAHGAAMRRLHIETVPNAGKHWMPPEGGRWGSGYGPDEEHAIYDVVDRSRFTLCDEDETRVVKRWQSTEIIHSMATKSGPYCRMEESDARKERRQLAEKFNEVLHSNHFSHYDIERLQAHFNITPKTEDVSPA